jgi:hypothetical protein
MTPEEQYVRQKIPVEIEGGKSITIKIRSLSGNGVNDVGILCSPDLWSALTNGSNSIRVRLIASNKSDTEIGRVDPGGGSAFLGYITNAHYLFSIAGKYHAKATVEIAFPNGPPPPTHAYIIIGKTPADTGL